MNLHSTAHNKRLHQIGAKNAPPGEAERYLEI